MLDALKRWFESDQPDAYEEQTLEREYRQLEAKIQRIDGKLGHVKCKSCPKDLDPKAKRLLTDKRSHEERQDEIEDRLGYTPATKQRVSRRASKRNGG